MQNFIHQHLTKILVLGYLTLLLAFMYTHTSCWRAVNHRDCPVTPNYCYTYHFQPLHAFLNTTSPFEIDCDALILSKPLMFLIDMIVIIVPMLCLTFSLLSCFDRMKKGK